MKTRLGRIGEAGPVIALALVTYIPLLVTHRGQVGADTKNYLYLDPSRLLSRAWTMWDPNVGLGTVTHQNIGYLWPMGPFYWLFETVGVPDWLAQRIWLGSILFLAGLGVRYLLRTLGQRGVVIGVAMFAYALSPYVLSLSARLSALLLPFVALPWMIGLAVRSGRERSWRHPALFALLVATTGSTNATALLLAGVAPALWFVFAVAVERELRLRHALAAVGRIGLLTVVCSLWWMGGLYAQGSFGIDVLRYSETARTVANDSTAPELLRGLGYWFFYGEDKLGPWIEPSVPYTQNLALISVTFLLPIVGLLGAGLLRWKHRAYFASLVLVGMVLAVGAHPWESPPPFGKGVKAFLTSDAGLAMRSLPRAVPLVMLGLSVFAAVAISALAAWLPRVVKPLALAMVVLAVAGLPPLWTGNMVAKNLERPEQLPDHFAQAAAAWDEGPQDTRVMEVPGIDFAAYRWGNTVDPVTPGIMDRPYVARELIPYGTPAAADLLNAFDRQLQEGTLDPDAVAPMARFLGVGEVALRSDIAYERYNVARPPQLYRFLGEVPDLGAPVGYGPATPNVPDAALPLRDELDLASPPDLADPPEVASFPVLDPEPILRLQSGAHPVVVAGDADGLVNTAGAGLLTGHELVLFSAPYAGDGAELRRRLGADGELVLTDSHRKAGRRWGTVTETNGFTEEAGPDAGALRADPTDNRLPVFGEPDVVPDATRTVVEHRGVHARATGYGNPVSFTAEDRPAMAVDDDPETAWRVAAFSKAVDEAIELRWDEARTTDRLRLTQPLDEGLNRSITEVGLSFDGGPMQVVALDDSSLASPGQEVAFGRRTFSTLRITVLATTGPDFAYDGLSPVGFGDIRLGDDDAVLDEVVRLPTDLLDAVGPASADHPLSVVLDRRRTRPSLALREDEELSIERTFDLPTARSFSVAGEVRISTDVDDDLVDRLIGLPSIDDGGVEAVSSRRLPGDLGARASAAIDGDPTTHWSPGFLNQVGEEVRYRTAEPVTFDRMSLTVVADGRHSVPTRLRIERPDGAPVEVDVPALLDQEGRDATTTVPLTFPEVTGTDLTFVVDAVREVETNDWYSKQPITMPVGIAELGVPGLAVAVPSGSMPRGCRSGLVTVAGQDVPVRLDGDVADALAGQALAMAPCDPGAGVATTAGAVEVRTADGRRDGLDVDRLVLRSAAGGGAEAEPGAPLVEEARAGTADGDPTLRIVDEGRTAFDVEVSGTDDTWLVLGQSQSLGWHATVDGRDLGPPTLVNGYANGWLLPQSDRPISVALRWTPQRVVNAGLIASAVGVVLALLLAFVPRRRRRSPDDPVVDLDPPPMRLRLATATAFAGDRPRLLTVVVAAIATFAIGTALIGVVSGAALAAAAVAALRWRRARLLTGAGPAILLGLCAAVTLGQQVRRGTPAGYEWPTSLEALHQVGWSAVGLLVIGVVADRLWSGSWWTTPASAEAGTGTALTPRWGRKRAPG